MQWKQIETEWPKMKSDVQTKWSKLTDDEFTKVAGKKNSLVGKVQQHYSMSKDDADKQVTAWSASYKLSGSANK